MPHSWNGGAPPRYATPRTFDRPTLGVATAEIAEELGAPLMPWQLYVADVAGEISPSGRMAYDLVVVTVPRQAGKTTLVRALAMQTAMERGGRVWYTAQKRNDARDAWMDSIDAVQRSALGSSVRVRLTNGSESLTVKESGGTYRVFAPLGAALHGRQSDRTFLDEGWAHDLARGRELMQAIVPTQATRRRPQIFVLSTAGTDHSEWLRELVIIGRAGTNPRMAYFEWSCDEDVSADDLDAIEAAHPAVGYTITRESLESARAVLKEGTEFLRAYGNVWTSGLEVVIQRECWEACADDAPLPAGAEVAFGFDTTPDRDFSTIVVAARGADGRTVVEVVDHRPGVTWLADRVAELDRRWKPVAIVADSVGPAASITDKLNRARTKVATTGTRDYATACQALYDAIHEGPTLAVRPSPELDAAAHAVGKRTLGEAGWAWARRASVPISPLVAATLAVYGLDHPTTRRRAGVMH